MDLRDVYKSFSRKLDIFFQKQIETYPHSCSYGYLGGRNTRGNAEKHVGKKYLLNADLCNFFDSISADKVRLLFVSCGVDEKISQILSRFLTISSRLPMGLSTSPVIANVLAHKMDCELSDLAEKFNCQYSRYVDDLTFSSDEILPEISHIEEIVARHNFSLAHEKINFSKSGQAHYVTGLSVSDAEAPHIPRKIKKDLRKSLYYMDKFGIYDHFGRLGIHEHENVQREVNRIDGLVHYVSYHEPRKSFEINAIWQKILRDSGFRPYFSAHKQEYEVFNIIIDEAEFSHNGTNYLALAASVTNKQSEIDNSIFEILDNFLSNPWSDGKVDLIKERGLHYVDCTEDLKKEFIQCLQILPFNGYISINAVGESNYRDRYIENFKNIIMRNYYKIDRSIVFVSIEKNSKISNDDIYGVVDYVNSYNLNDKRVILPKGNVSFVGKECLGVSVPDFLLGCFAGYIKDNQTVSGGAKSRKFIQFEMLRDKIKVVSDLTTNQHFTRRNPFSKSKLKI